MKKKTKNKVYNSSSSGANYSFITFCVDNINHNFKVPTSIYGFIYSIEKNIDIFNKKITTCLEVINRLPTYKRKITRNKFETIITPYKKECITISNKLTEFNTKENLELSIAETNTLEIYNTILEKNINYLKGYYNTLKYESNYLDSQSNKKIYKNKLNVRFK